MERRAAYSSKNFWKGSPIGLGSRDPKPLSADILSARKYNRPSEKLTGHSPVARYFFNPGVSSVGLSTSARPYSFSFARQPEWPSALADMYIYVYTSPPRHAKRPPGNFYSSDPGPRDSLEWSEI